MSGEDLILYVSSNQVSIPNCVQVPEVTMEYMVAQCFEHIPVWYNDTKGKLVKGYLTKEKIIVLTSQTADCTYLTYNIISDNEQRSKDSDLIRFQGHMFTGNFRSNKEQLNIINVNRNRLNFMHTSILDNILENTRETFTRIIGNSTFYYTIGPKLESENLEKIINN